MAELRRMALHVPQAAPTDAESATAAPTSTVSVGAAPTNVTYAVHHPGRPRAAVAIHGFRGDHHGLALIADALDLTVFIPDLPGFGATAELHRAHDLPAFTSFVDAFIAALRLPSPPVLIGHSFGTIVGAAFAADHAEAIERVVLVNPIATIPTHGPRRAATALAVGYYSLGAALPERIGRRLLAARIANEVMSVTMTKTKEKNLRRFIRGQHNRYFSAFGSRRALLAAFTVSTTRTVTEFAHQLTTPTLIVAGDRDDLASVDDQRALAGALPDARLVVIAGVGHLSHYEAPIDVAHAIQGFVDEGRAPTRAVESKEASR